MDASQLPPNTFSVFGDPPDGDLSVFHFDAVLGITWTAAEGMTVWTASGMVRFQRQKREFAQDLLRAWAAYRKTGGVKP